MNISRNGVVITVLSVSAGAALALAVYKSFELKTAKEMMGFLQKLVDKQEKILASAESVINLLKKEVDDYHELLDYSDDCYQNNDKPLNTVITDINVPEDEDIYGDR